MATTCTRVPRRLSYCNLKTFKWTPVSLEKPCSQIGRSHALHQPSPTARFSLLTWNMDAFGKYPTRRAKSLLDFILEESRKPDIVFLQEIRPDVRASLLGNPKVREDFFTTDAEDDAAFENKQFATMTLMCRKRFSSGFDSRNEGNQVDGGAEKLIVGSVARVKLQSRYERDGLYVDIIPPHAPETYYRLINVHLDSLKNFPFRRGQLKVLASLLRETGCCGGLIAGDFNSIEPEDAELMQENGMVDAWITLHGNAGPEASTWSAVRELVPGLQPKRLDKVALMNMTVEGMEILHPGYLSGPGMSGDRNAVGWSDHSGLALKRISAMQREAFRLVHRITPSLPATHHPKEIIQGEAPSYRNFLNFDPNCDYIIQY